jgi:hypothetical protein
VQRQGLLTIMGGHSYYIVSPSGARFDAVLFVGNGVLWW